MCPPRLETVAQNKPKEAENEIMPYAGVGESTAVGAWRCQEDFQVWSLLLGKQNDQRIVRFILWGQRSTGVHVCPRMNP